MDKLNINELGAVYADVIASIVSTVSGFYLEALPDDGDGGFEEMTGAMSLSGEKSGMLFISAAENDMRLLCSYMTGVFPEEVTAEETEDALCELVNMVAGSAKLRLSASDYMFSLSTPFIIRGCGVALITKNKTRLIAGSLGNGEISVKFKVIY